MSTFIFNSASNLLLYMILCKNIIIIISGYEAGVHCNVPFSGILISAIKFIIPKHFLIFIIFILLCSNYHATIIISCYLWVMNKRILFFECSLSLAMIFIGAPIVSLGTSIFHFFYYSLSLNIKIIICNDFEFRWKIFQSDCKLEEDWQISMEWPKWFYILHNNCQQWTSQNDIYTMHH